MRRECELKYRINVNEYNLLNRKLIELGFLFQKDIVETDFILDTEDRSCRNSGILFRVRIETDCKKHWSRTLVTVKNKKRNSMIANNRNTNLPVTAFQDNAEMEFDVCNADEEEVLFCIDCLKNATGCSLSKDDFIRRSLFQLMHNFFIKGFTHLEVLQKKRVYYNQNSVNVCLDSFPGGKGKFIEVETYNETDLYDTVELLGMSPNNLESRSYGELILENSSGKCFFHEKIIYDSHENKYVSIDDILNVIMKTITD